MKRLLAHLLPLLVLSRLAAAGLQTVPLNITPSPDGQRYLFIIGTSSSMERLEESGRQALFDLIFTGLGGHMRHGDTFGVWTYNKKLNAGDLPMQTWATNDLLQLGSHITLFVKGQDYESKLRTEVALGAALNVIKQVKDVHIFFITDDTIRIKGTPFDDAVNEAYKDRADEVREKGLPFITTILGRDGKLINVSVVLAGETMTLPARHDPKPEPVVAAVKPATRASRPPAAAPARTIVIKRDTLPDGTKSSVMVNVDGKPAPVATRKDDIPLNGTSHVTPVPAQTVAVTPNPQSAAIPVETVPVPTSEPPPVLVSTAPPSDPGPPSPPTTPGTGESVPPAPAATTEPTAAIPSAGIGSTLARLQPEPMPVSAREPVTGQTAPPRSGVTGVVSPVAPSMRDSFLWVIGGVTFVLVAITLAIVFGMMQRRSHQHSAITQSMYRR